MNTIKQLMAQDQIRREVCNKHGHNFGPVHIVEHLNWLPSQLWIERECQTCKTWVAIARWQ